MSTQTEPIVVEKSASPERWHVGLRHKGAFPILNVDDRPVGLAFRPGSARMFAATPELLWLAKQITEADPDPCRLDHHGLCQAHWLGNPCEVAVARRVVAQIEGAQS